MYVAHKTLEHQRQHNVLTVKPIPEITLYDGEDSLRVKLRNHGVGPLLVRHLTVSNGMEDKEKLLDWMKPLPEGLTWTNFANSIKDRTVPPGEEIVLLELTDESDDNNLVDPAIFGRARRNTRLCLSNLTVKVKYTDIYGSKFDTHSQELNWFGRHFSDVSSGMN